MNANEDKNLDKLARKVIAKAEVETPSFNFTDAVMHKVDALNKKSVVVYKPLISKTTWAVLSLVLVAVVLFVMFSGNQAEPSSNWFSVLNFDLVSNNAVSNTLSKLNFSKALMYAVLFLAIMVLVQVSLLKNYFNKRYQI